MSFLLYVLRLKIIEFSQKQRDVPLCFFILRANSKYAAEQISKALGFIGGKNVEL